MFCMNKKTRPLGLRVTPKEVYEGVRDLREEDRVFVYLLWLTAARTNEIARMNQQDIFKDEFGELCYTISLSKLKRPEPLSNPLNLFKDDEWENRMEIEVLEYVGKLEPFSPLFPDYVEVEKMQEWTSKKTGEVRQGIVKRFYTPYDRIVRNSSYRLYPRFDNGERARRSPLHWLRNFAITYSLLKVPADPLFSMQRVGHKKLDTTMRYWTESRAEFRNKLAKIRQEKRSI